MGCVCKRRRGWGCEWVIDGVSDGERNWSPKPLIFGPSESSMRQGIVCKRHLVPPPTLACNTRGKIGAMLMRDDVVGDQTPVPGNAPALLSTTTPRSRAM